MTSTIERLAEFQAAFGRILRTPLERSASSLRAQLARYDASACAAVLPSQTLSAAERLAVYNRQYWFRLFGVLQTDYPLTARLAGMWRFNALAERFLLESPPRDPDLARAGDGFDRFLERDLPSDGLDLGNLAPRIPRDALLQAARIDAAFRVAFRAPLEPSFQPTSIDAEPMDAERVAQGRLRASKAFVLIHEDWPLMKLRHESRQVAAKLIDGERPIPLPPSHPDGTHHFSISRADDKQQIVALAPLQAALLQLLRTHSVPEALAQLEAQCTAEHTQALAQNVQRWLESSVRLGYWVGVDP